MILQGEAIAHTNFWITPNLTPEKRKAETDQLEPTGVKFRGVLRAVNEGGKVEVSGTDLVVTKANAVTLAGGRRDGLSRRRSGRRLRSVPDSRRQAL